MKRQIIVVDSKKPKDRLKELATALTDPHAKIVSEVSCEGEIFYVVESNEKPKKTRK